MPGERIVRPVAGPLGASGDALARDAELQAAAIRGYLAGYGQALTEARELLGLSPAPRRGRSPRWARIVRAVTRRTSTSWVGL